MGHYEIANVLSCGDYCFGMPAILIMTIVDALVFDSISTQVASVGAKVAVGLFSVLATAFFSL